MPERLIERMTRALLRQRLLKLGHLPGPALDAAIDVEWPEYKNFARAALTAIREPSDEEFGEALVSERVVETGDHRDFWRAMIDAALR